MSDPKTAPLEWFVIQMLHNLSRPSNVDKPHWNTITDEQLFQRIRDELLELQEAVCLGGSSEQIIHECVDTANFCMMLADNANNRKEPGNEK